MNKRQSAVSIQSSSDHHQGLPDDLQRIQNPAASTIDRRQMLKVSSIGALALAGCNAAQIMGLNDVGAGDSSINSGDAGADSSSGSCSPIPEETAGPYPGDGSNGVNALVLSGIVRSAITESFAGSSGSATGVALTIDVKLVDRSCRSLAGYVVYLWHCDREGKYSLYSSGVTNQNYLRGVQECDENGSVTFTSIFPGCYDGRWPHIHFEVYPSLASATNSANKVATSQLALPAAACNEVYANSAYSSSVSNFSRISLSSDNVFSDGSSLQVPSYSGDPTSGYKIELQVSIGV